MKAPTGSRSLDDSDAHPLPAQARQALLHGRGAASIGLWTLVAILALWAGVLLHEAGHYVLGPVVHAGFASWGAGSVTLRRVLGTGGGPAVTLALVVAAWAYGRSGAPRGANGAANGAVHCAVAFVVACTAAVRLLLLAPALLFGQTGFDEARLAELTGTPVVLLWGGPAVVAALVATTLARRIPPTTRRPVYLGLVAGLVLGLPMVLLLGPRLGLPI